MNLRSAVLMGSMVVVAAISGCSSSDKEEVKTTSTSTQAPNSPLTVEESIEVDMTARVMAIDPATRVMTLRGENGHEVTLVAGNQIRRLNEVRVGDNVKTKYKATLLAELRPPTAEEAAYPVAMVEADSRTPRGMNPSGARGEAIRVVTTVQAVDVDRMLVTLRGPMGDTAVVKGKRPENVRRLRVGDTIVLTYTETVAISLEQIAVR